MNIRLIYLYLFSAVGLIVAVIGNVRLVDLGLKVIVFQGADRYEYYAPKLEGEITDQQQISLQERENRRQRERELSGSIAMIAVGLPLYFYHWRTIQKDNKDDKNA